MLKSALSFSLSKTRTRKSHSLTPSTKFPAKYQPTNFTTFSQLLKQRPSLPHLKQIHAQIFTQSLSSNPHSISSLIHSYLSSNRLNSAIYLFDNYPSSPIPTLLWNLMIRAHSKIRNCVEPIKYLGRMLSNSNDELSRVLPDDYTFTFVITSCSHYDSSLYGEIVHGMIIKSGFGSDLFVGNSLINLYSVFAKVGDARKVFDEMSERDVFSWTSLLGGYAKHGDIDKACDIFRAMPVRSDVSWVVMISGLVSNERYIDALDYFRGMLNDSKKVKPDEAALVCALSACANLGAFDQGNWIHVYMERNNILETPNICTALIDMYAKCGRIDCAIRVFNRISKRDVHNFTSMISGLSIHGLGKDAMRVFSDMLAEGIRPNEITMLGVLNGCSHSGLVEESTSIFNDMETLCGIVPKIEHYGCYVDCLARAGHLERAFDVVKTMPIEPDAAIWRALLSGCRTHRDIVLGEQILNHVRQLGSSGQVLLSSLYAYMGKWESVVSMRKQMGGRRNTSELGCSWIEVDGITHEFRVDDQLHPRILEIRGKLDEILEKAKLGGYVTNTTPVTFDLSEEDKERAVSLHSEKLAIAFGFLSTKPGSLIRIVKNLRTCEDCHLALKAISLIFDREIIVRDRSRFHAFKHGKCSCNDYW
ncbi:pentatricopeptide repeat-containing protein At3g62890-like [Chenopodium quinoa]|uniref:pentatricopeptide repeat-containing protein At3g62890-like n=1 Tax=Chenopodium quinoa TaxID=63459 RepID=UPI000B786A9C|nr:pentatricopeptide repeat-containing protein At3g62890-like [Chenopodium quinoa]